MVLPISEIPQSTDPTILTDDQTLVIIKSVLSQLDVESEPMNEYRDYYDGEQKLKYATLEFRKAFGKDFGDLIANWCEIAISATEDRLEMDRIVFRSGELEDIDQEVTEAIWEVMLANDIDALENELYSSAMIEGRAAVIVWPSQVGDDQEVLVSVNRGQTVFVIYEDDNPLRPLFAVKKWRTQLGQINLTLYTQEWVYKYKSTARSLNYLNDIFDKSVSEASNWERRPVSETGDPSWPLKQPFSRIPVIEFRGRKNRSELQNITPIQDAVNKTLINMLVAADYAAQSQTFIISSNQEPDGGWKRRPGEVWQIQPEVDLDGKALPTSVGSLPAEDLSKFISVIEHLLAQFSNLSATPGYYIFNSNSQSGRGDAPSGDSLKISETTLMKKVQKYQQMYGSPLVRVGMLIYEALLIRGAVSGVVPAYGEVLWSSPQKHFMGMLLEEGRKMIDELGLPHEYAWEHIGLTQAQMGQARIELDQRLADELANELAGKLAKEQASQGVALSGDAHKQGILSKTADQHKSGSTPANT